MVLSLQHLSLSVPDLKVGADFYTAFGMNMAEGQNALGFRCDGKTSDEIVLVESGQSRKFNHLSFATDQAGLTAIENRLKDKGIERLAKPFADAPDGLWFRDPDGNLVNVQEAEAAPRRAEPVPQINRPGVIERSAMRGCPKPTIAARPRRFGHMILFTPSVPRQLKFYTEVIGMQLSDTIVEEYGAFLRTAGDSDHHVVGFLHSDAPGFHHASFEMGSIDEAELGAMRLFGKGYKHAWGPGRHAIGSNYFHYFRDPWNGLAEYFFDIDYIPKEADWEPAEWTKKDGMFLWSADGPPPPDFGKNYEAV